MLIKAIKAMKAIKTKKASAIVFRELRQIHPAVHDKLIPEKFSGEMCEISGRFRKYGFCAISGPLERRKPGVNIINSRKRKILKLENAEVSTKWSTGLATHSCF